VRRWTRTPVAVALAATLATGCVATPEAATPPVTPADEADAPADEADAPADEADAPADEADAPPATCPPDARAAAAATIAGQLDAFARDDYAAALDFASDTFRSGTDVPTFRSLIERAFPQVASSEGHTVLGCEQPAAGVLRVLVVVTGVDGSSEELVYLVVDDGGRWGIEGAAPRPRPAGVPA
jgi:hypothetical protein